MTIVPSIPDLTTVTPMKPMKRLRKEVALQTSRFVPITIRNGISAGKKLYGDLFYNRRPKGYYEEEYLYEALDLEGAVVLEAGAHVGLYTMFFAERTVEGRVIAFEPNPLNYEYLCKNIRRNGLKNVETVNAGLSDEPGTLELVSSRFNRAKSTFKGDKQVLMKERGQPLIDVYVPVVTLDQVVEERGLERVDFVKIDTEGFEPYVVRGMRVILDTFKPLVYFEIHGLTEEQRRGDLQIVFDAMEPHNYRIRRVGTGAPMVTRELLPEFGSGAYIGYHAGYGGVEKILAHWL